MISIKLENKWLFSWFYAKFPLSMSIFSPKLGIDLGTANTLIYVPGKGIVLNEPSVVAISDYSKEILAIGLDAREMLGKTVDGVIAYRPMRDGVIADYRMTTALLAHFMRKALGFWFFIKPEVMISVPAGVTSTERRAVVEAAIKAGAKKAHIVREPIVAAIGAGIPINEPTGHIVVDIGGGTTDVAVISLGSIQSSISVKCAGNKIDHTITTYLKKKHNLAIGDRTAEKIKIKIGSAIPMDEPLEIVVKGRDYISGLPRSVHLNTNEIVEAIDGELREIIDAIKVVLQDTLPELASDIIDTGIVLTGGSSQLRNLTELIYRRTGVKCILAEEPLYAVVRGIGIALNHLDQYNRALISKPF